MIGALFFILVLAAAAIIPALAAWSFSRKSSHSIRLFSTLIGGQIVVTPAIALIAFSENRAGDENSIQTLLIYGGMALVFSIMTFAVREMVRVQNERK